MRAALLSIFIFAGPALASPEGALWDYDGGPGRPDCTSCHFDGEPVRNADAVNLEGLDGAAPGATVELTLTFDGEAEAAGFLMTASAGSFVAGEGVEARDGAARSTTPKAADEDGIIRWRLRWTTPAEPAADVAFYIALNAANMDASPFGDAIYLSTVSTSLGE